MFRPTKQAQQPPTASGGGPGPLPPLPSTAAASKLSFSSDVWPLQLTGENDTQAGFVQVSVRRFAVDMKKKKKTLPLNGPLRIGPEIWSMKIPPASKL